MQQLTPQDAVFLSMETDELPAHIGGLAFLEPTAGMEFSYEHFVARVRERLGACDRFSWQLQEIPFGVDRPYWVRRENFDPAMLIHQVAVPSPYSHEALSDLVGMLFERPLDRGQPLWEMDLIEGLPGGRYVLLWKMHHCMVDGAAGVGLSEQLFDVAPDAVRQAVVRTVDAAAAGDRVPTTAVIQQALRNAMAIPLKQSRFAGQAVTRLVRNLAATRDRSGFRRPLKTRRSTAPRVHFNGAVGRRRGLAWSSVSLDEVKRVKNTMSVTLNDVILALTSGAVRGYLADRGALPEASLIATVPVSTRVAGDTTLGNQLRDISIEWATDVADPLERLLAIHANAKEAKRRAKEEDALDLMGLMSEAFLPATLQILVRGAARLSDRIPLPANAVVSNVPMAPVPLYCGGARISQVVPISMLAPTQGMNITVLSYCDALYFGIVHDPELVPDAWDLAGRIPKSLLSLQAAVDQCCEADHREN